MRFIASILAYHAIHPQRKDTINTRPEDFAAHMAWLHSHGWQGVSLAALQAARRAGDPGARRMIAVTFDDGYLDNYTHALPILQQYGFTGTVFVVPTRVGTDVVHDEAWLTKHPDVPREAYRYMDWNQIAAMRDAGIEIGSHTMTHPLLDTISVEQQREEIVESRRVLQEKLGEKIASFCYPAGHYTEECLRFVGEAGYSQAVVTPWKRGLIRKDNPYTLKRSGLYIEDDLRRFQFKITPLFDLYRALRHAA